MRYRVCPRCGDRIDYGEACGCRDKKEAAPEQWGRHGRERTLDGDSVHHGFSFVNDFGEFLKNYKGGN